MNGKHPKQETPEQDALRYGQLAYDAYRAQTGGKSLATGDPLPIWFDLCRSKPEIARSWVATARAVRTSTLRGFADLVDRDHPGSLRATMIKHAARSLADQIDNPAPTEET
jgi:hypothetical protein